MNRRIGLWMLIGIMVASFWVVVGFLAGPTYNLGRFTLVAITAPASVLGHRMPLGVLGAILLNGCVYATLGLTIELLVRRPHRYR